MKRIIALTSLLSVALVSLVAITSARASDDPSGEPMPTGDLSQWTYVRGDDFTGSSLNTSVWTGYNGEPGGDPGGWWDQSHIVVGGGEVALKGYQDPESGDPDKGSSVGWWTTAGMKMDLSQSYGMYEVRAKMDNGTGIATVLLLWPQSGSWPGGGEIDFAEDGGQTLRSTSYMTDVYKGDCDSAHSCQDQQSRSVDWSQWHTYGVKWSPGSVQFTLDGQNVGTPVTENVPTGPMYLAIQDQMEGSAICGGWEACPDSATPAEADFDVDWVAVWKPAGS